MNKSGKMIRGESSYSGGLESYFDAAAILALCFGGIHFLVSLLSLHWIGFVTSIYIAFGTFLGWLLLRGIAELIRLQKKIAGVPFSGAITLGTEHIHYCCSACGKPFYGNVEVRCEHCGADLQDDDAGSDNTGSEG